MPDMELRLKRIARREKYTIGKLYVDGKYFCDTIEDKDRGLKQSMDLEEILKRKVYGETAIPSGTYDVDMDTPSGKYQLKAVNDKYYEKYCRHMPRIRNIKGYSGVLIHPGTDENSTLGCLIVGENKVVGKVINSRTTFSRLWDVLYGAYLKDENIKLTIE